MDKALRIVAIADSLSMPRPPKHGSPGTRWEETWPKVLERLLREIHPSSEVINAGKRSRTAEDLEARELVGFIEPDIIILQIGIVDCAPRVFSRRQRQIVSLAPERLRNFIIRQRSANRFRLTARNPLQKVYTKPAAFERALRTFRDYVEKRSPTPRVLVLPVLVDERLAKKSSGYLTNASLYNGILARVWGDAFIPPAEFSRMHTDDFFLEDGQHLTPSGNRRIAELLYARVT